MENKVINCVCQETINKVSGLMLEKFIAIVLLKAVSPKSGHDIVGYLWKLRGEPMLCHARVDVSHHLAFLGQQTYQIKLLFGFIFHLLCGSLSLRPHSVF